MLLFCLIYHRWYILLMAVILRFYYWLGIIECHHLWTRIWICAVFIRSSPSCDLLHSSRQHLNNDEWRLSEPFSTYRTTAVLRPFFRDHPGEPVPEGNFWTLWCKGEANTPTIRLGATPSRLTSAHLQHPPHTRTLLCHVVMCYSCVEWYAQTYE